ncbi:hypothetical protein CAPTEDRAFT_66510, partial [Capitella teleta]
YLSLNENEISEVTGAMFRNMTKLTQLYLDHNYLKSNSFSLPESVNLTLLHLVGNPLMAFPDVRNMTTLLDLRLEHTQLTSIPEEIFSKLTSLRILNLAKNQITIDGIPDVAGPNGTLVNLYLSDNP